MKSAIISILFFNFLILSGSMAMTDEAYAEAVEIWNSSGLAGITDTSNLRLHGMMLVWQAKGGLAGTSSGRTDTEIFCCNLETMEVRQITDDNNNDTMPETDGRYVVWQKYVRGNGTSIYLFDGLYGTPAGGSRISSTAEEDSAPFVSKGHVVWTSQRVDTVYRPGTIKLFSPATDSAPHTISNPSVDSSNPFIENNRIVWTQTVTDGIMLTSEMWQYDMNWYNPTAEPLPEWVSVRRSPSSDGQYTVFTQNDGVDDEIFLFGRESGFVQLTDDENRDSSPVMSQNHVAWISNGTIVAAEISDIIKVSGLNASGVRSRDFMLRWKRIFSEGVEDYRIDLSTRPDFSIPVPGYTDRSVGNRSYWRVSGLRPETQYFYRMRAVVNGSTTSDSETGSVTTAKEPTTRNWWLSRLKAYRTIFYQRTNTIRTYFSHLVARLRSLLHNI